MQAESMLQIVHSIVPVCTAVANLKSVPLRAEAEPSIGQTSRSMDPPHPPELPLFASSVDLTMSIRFSGACAMVRSLQEDVAGACLTPQHCPVSAAARKNIHYR